jgi:anti-sigma-K factor RskA
MVECLSADEIEELLGAYALDAVDDFERRQIDDFLRRSPGAREEVAEMQHVAAHLAYGDVDAPAGLWRRIKQALEHADRARAPAPRGRLRARGSRRRWR